MQDLPVQNLQQLCIREALKRVYSPTSIFPSVTHVVLGEGLHPVFYDMEISSFSFPSLCGFEVLATNMYDVNLPCLNVLQTIVHSNYLKNNSAIR